MGDFNAISSLDEKTGGRRFGTKSSDDFVTSFWETV